MAVATLFLILLGLVALVVIGSAVYGVASRPPPAMSRGEVKALTRRESHAIKGLRKIANGTGNPELEAQLFLDEIESNYETKEIE